MIARLSIPLAVIWLLTQAGAIAQDTTAPLIVNLSYTPTAVDTFTSAATVTVTVQIADDLAGVQGGCIATFYSPSGTQYAQVCVNTSDRISGTAQDGVYRVTITIPRYAEAGTWHLHGGALVDVVGNLRRYTETEFAQLGFLTTLSVTSVPDTTAPSIRALSYTPTAVDTFTLAATITVTVQIADDLAGVQGGCIATFYSPSGTQYAQVCVNTSDRISGTAQDGVYRVTITIPRYAEAGTWHLHGGALVDVVGNLRRYTETEFAQLGFLTTLSVTSVPDTTAPSIRALSYTPTAVDTFTSAATVTVTVQIADDLAGVQGGCIATFYSPSGTQYAQVCVNTSDRISGTAQDGVYRVTITIPRYAEAGTWHLHGGALVDVVGNLRRYTETEFAQLGFLTTLSVIGNVPPIADAGADASVEVGASVVLNGFGSYDPEGGTLRYEWMEGAGILLGTAATISVQATLGSKAYTLRVTDAVGLTGLDSVVITGVDTTPPVLILPGSITVDATSPTGAAVTYIVTVSDNADSSPSVECRPPSGTIFPLGATAVRCSASDATGNTSTDTFQITVRGATEQALNLTTFVQALNLKQGISSSLDAKLQNIRAALAATTAGDRVTACNMLSAFVKEVQAQIGKTLTEVEANDLIAAARRIQVLLGC